MKSLAVLREALDILGSGTDPDGIVAHPLDIIELVYDGLPCTSAVNPVASVARGARG